MASMSYKIDLSELERDGSTSLTQQVAEEVKRAETETGEP